MAVTKSELKVPAVSHLFQVQLVDTNLDAQQVERLASTIRAATKNELLKMDFRLEELTPLFERPGADRSGCDGCGGACHA